MPTYDYRCKSCNSEQEESMSINDSNEVPCKSCGHTMHRIIKTFNYVLRGGGWGGADLREKNERLKHNDKMKLKSEERMRSGG